MACYIEVSVPLRLHELAQNPPLVDSVCNPSTACELPEGLDLEVTLHKM